MANYTKTTDFTAKDALSTGDPAKVVSGALHDDEFDALAVAIATKADIASPTFTGTTTFANLVGASGATVTAVLDEDTLVSDSATKLATQQSIKAYVDSQISSNNGLTEILTTDNTTGGVNIIVTAGDSITTDTISETTAASGVTIDGTLIKDGTVTANLTGNADTVTTNANLTGHVTSVGNAAVLGSFTTAQLNTAISDATIATSGGAFHDGFSDFVANEHIDWTSTTSALSTSGTAATGALTVTGAASATTTVSDGLGELRVLPSPDAQKTGSYTLDTGDVGVQVLLGASGAITIPTATFAADDLVTIVNQTATPATITCTITTAYVAGADVATASLSAYGVCTIAFTSGTVCHITGDVS